MSTSRSSPGRCSMRCPQPAGFASIQARSRLPRAISRIRSSPISTVGEYFAMAPPSAPRSGCRIIPSARARTRSVGRRSYGRSVRPSAAGPAPPGLPSWPVIAPGRLLAVGPTGRAAARRNAVHTGHGFEAVVHLELRKDVLDVVADRGLADEELIGDGRGARPGAHEGDHLQLAPTELRDRRERLAARELELRLGELLPDQQLDLVRRRHVAEEMDDRRRSPVPGRDRHTAHIDPQGLPGLGPSRHVEVLDQIAAVQERPDRARPAAQPVPVAVASLEDVAARLAEDLIGGVAEEAFRSLVPEENLAARPAHPDAVRRVGEERRDLRQRLLRSARAGAAARGATPPRPAPGRCAHGPSPVSIVGGVRAAVPGSCTGSATSHTQPAPGALRSAMRPPICSTASRQNGSPRPVPAVGSLAGLRRPGTNRSKIRAWRSSGIPRPWSITRSTTWSSTCAPSTRTSPLPEQEAGGPGVAPPGAHPPVRRDAEPPPLLLGERRVLAADHRRNLGKV